MTQKSTLPDETAAKPRPCLAQALRLLNRRAMSDQALQDELALAGYDATDIGAALAQMRTWGYINDTRLGESVVAAAQRQKKGPAWLHQQLSRRKLPQPVVSQCMAALRSDSAQLAQDTLMRRFGAAKLADSPTALRAMRLLQRRGFDFDVIRDAIKVVSRANGPDGGGADDDAL